MNNIDASIDLIRTATDEKLSLVKKVMTFHPGLGTDKGWSWYVGGMRDTGEWKIDVLLTTRDFELQLFIDEQELADKERKIEFERVQSLSKEEKDKEWVQAMNEQHTLKEKLLTDFERALLWGKDFNYNQTII